MFSILGQRYRKSVLNCASFELREQPFVQMYDTIYEIRKREFRISLVDLTIKGGFGVPLARQSSLFPWVDSGPLNSGKTLLGYFHIPLTQLWCFKGGCETDSDDKILLNIYSTPQMDISAHPEPCEPSKGLQLNRSHSAGSSPNSDSN